MKNLFKASASVLAILLCFGACSSSKPPEEPITTGQKSYTYKNEFGMTAPVAENIGDYPGVTQPVKYVETSHKIECVFNSWYTFGKTYATIESVEFEDIDAPQNEIYGFAKAKLISKGRDKQMKIGYKAYDENGNIIKSNGCLTRNISSFDDGDTFEFLFNVPFGTAKIEFFDYTEN